MAKLYFKYGAMGSSKSANALITKFNYQEKEMNVWLIKPSIDNRDGNKTISSRIGISQEADVINQSDDILFLYREKSNIDVIISDESQFFSELQINQLRTIVDNYNIPVICFGLRTDFQTKLFSGSKRLFEIADSITEIKTICACGSKAIVNARIDSDGKVITIGDKILLGGNDSYVAMCHKCYVKAVESETDIK